QQRGPYFHGDGLWRHAASPEDWHFTRSDLDRIAEIRPAKVANAERFGVAKMDGRPMRQGKLATDLHRRPGRGRRHWPHRHHRPQRVSAADRLVRSHRATGRVWDFAGKTAKNRKPDRAGRQPGWLERSPMPTPASGPSTRRGPQRYALLHR